MVNETEKKKLHRIFICIDFPEEAIKEIARAQDVLGNWKFTGKLTELENLHLTLKFLGEIDENKLGEIREKLKEIRFKKMELGLGNVGSFGYRGKPRIIWIKIFFSPIISAFGIFNSFFHKSPSIFGLLYKLQRFCRRILYSKRVNSGIFPYLLIS